MLRSADYKEITNEILDRPTAEESPVLPALMEVFGDDRSQSEYLDETPVSLYGPSGNLVQALWGNTVRIWAPRGISETRVLEWREKLLQAIKPCGSKVVTRVTLCDRPVSHRWSFDSVDLHLFPVPASAPRSAELLAKHPALIRTSIDSFSNRTLDMNMRMRRLGWWHLLLSGFTSSSFSVESRSQKVWALERDTAKPLRSKCLDELYETPEIHDERELAEAFDSAQPGIWQHPIEYYLGWGSVITEPMRLPHGVDESLAAAEALSPRQKFVMRKACKWMNTSTESHQTSQSLSYIACICALESLAVDLFPTERKPTRRFKQFLERTLPAHAGMSRYAADLYRIRCDVVHEGAVFDLDWMYLFPDVSLRHVTASLVLFRVARLAIVNWTRLCAGGKLVGG